MPTVVAAPPELAGALRAEPWLEVVAWDSHGEAPRSDIEVWVPAYAVGRTAEDISATIGTMPGLRVVQLLTAGVEPWPRLMPPGVTLCAGKTIHGGSTAELAVAMTLALVRDLPRYAVQQAERRWDRHHPDTIAGKHVLVLGAGDIGRRVAATFETLDAQVTLAARSRHTSLAEAEALLPEVDVLVVALPLTDQTHRLVDESWIGALPDSAIVVNVARGPIVDLDALTKAVQTRGVRAALDVTDPEPLPADHPLWSLPGVLITPHTGGGATGWEHRAERLVTAQLTRLHEGEPLQYVVTAGY